MRKTGDASNGLSPRVRGNHVYEVFGVECRGSIPACAGEPRSSTGAGIPLSVYPRVCGGTNNLASFYGWPDGLSPRVRGNRVEHVLDERADGSIPACAGEPASPWAWASASPVYPRVCGGTALSGG